MSYTNLNGTSKDSGEGKAVSAAEATLRLIASLPAPEGLEDRVHAALHAAPRRARVLAWPVAPAGEWMRAAAAAAIVCVVAGGGWGIYSHVQPGPAYRGVAGPPVLRSPVPGPGQFSTGEARRRPQTLVGPTVTPPTVAPTPKSKASSKTAPITSPGAKTAASKSPAAPAAPLAQ